MPLPIRPLILLIALLCTGCGTASSRNPDLQEAPLLSSPPRDFSGYWEKNFQLSDDFNNRFRLYIADVQRLYTATGGRGDLQGGIAAGAGVSVDTINGLARFTEELTRMPLLEIVQDKDSINIDRDDDFTLRCRYQDRQYTSSSNPFGNDQCGWSQERLLFQMSLPGGLNITHQFSLSPDSAMLNVTTRVNSGSVSVPLIISNYYQRYVPPEPDYNCLLTLTRNTVCSQNGEPQ